MASTKKGSAAGFDAQKIADRGFFIEALKTKAAGARRTATAIAKFYRENLDYLGAEDLESFKKAEAALNRGAKAYQHAHEIRERRQADEAKRRAKAGDIVARTFGHLSAIEDKVAFIGFADRTQLSGRLLQGLTGENGSWEARYLMSSDYDRALGNVAYQATQHPGDDMEVAIAGALENFEGMRKELQIKYAAFIVAVTQATQKLNQGG